jgi:putative thioredoxin
VDATDRTFREAVIERSHEVPVVVDFWADWCGPCKVLTPVLEQKIGERDGQVELVKVDVDANQAVAAEYGIRGIPAVKAFRNGHVVREFVGAVPPQSVDTFLDEVLGPSATDRLLAELEESGRYPEVTAALREQDHERALELLLAEIERSEGDERDEIRRMMVALFTGLGQDHPLSSTFRRRLATALY